MGFRFRKSIKLPGGFRVNLSNSGVGYSWGTKGYRVTKTAKGTTRETVTIPGTGISHARETSAKPSQTPRQIPGKSDPIKQRHGCLTQIVAISLLLLLIVGIYSGCAHSEAEDPGVNRDTPASTQPEVESKSPSPAPVQSTAGDDELASECLTEFFDPDMISSLTVTDRKIEAKILDAQISEDAEPDDWDTVCENFIAASNSLQEQFEESSIKNIALQLINSENAIMLTVLNGKITYSAYETYENSYNPPTISLKEFNSIQTGMSFQEVVDIIGGPGSLISQVDIGDDYEYRTEMYSWDGEGSIGANANVMFQGGKVVSKAQFGLE